MTVLDKYRLRFYTGKDIHDGEKIFWCRREGISDEYNQLALIGRLDTWETESFIEFIDNGLAGEINEEYFVSDSVEDKNIRLSYPNIIIGEEDSIVISMLEMKEILQEWYNFVSSRIRKNTPPNKD